MLPAHQHWEYPYPNKGEKRALAAQAGIGFSQVTNWFVNARARLWKPIVQQMGTSSPDMRHGAPSGNAGAASAPSSMGGAASAAAAMAAGGLPRKAAKTHRNATAGGAAGRNAATSSPLARAPASTVASPTTAGASLGGGTRRSSVAARTAAAAAVAAGHVVQHTIPGEPTQPHQLRAATARCVSAHCCGWCGVMCHSVLLTMMLSLLRLWCPLVHGAVRQ